MERYHIYKLGLAILFYAVYYTRQTVVNGLKIDDVASTTNITDYRERRDAEDDNQFFYQGADGVPGVDFPTLSYVPRTQFSCKEMEAGYYADTETDCQVFHICDEGRKLSFLCPNGTIFQQADLICDWWYKVNCTTSPSLYEESAEILQRESAKRRKHKEYGTKQSVFQDFGRDNGGGRDLYRGTPAHFVTPSYPYKPSINNIDNRISASTEGSVRRTYDERFDRKLETVGNGVREGTSDRTDQFAYGRGQNAFDINLQGKTEIRGGFQGRGRGQASFSTTTSSRQSFGFGSYSTVSPPQGTFGLKTQTSSTDRDRLAFGNQQRGSGSQLPGQRGFATSTPNIQVTGGQNTFGTVNQQIGSNRVPFGTRPITPIRDSFDRNIQITPAIEVGDQGARQVHFDQGSRQRFNSGLPPSTLVHRGFSEGGQKVHFEQGTQQGFNADLPSSTSVHGGFSGGSQRVNFEQSSQQGFNAGLPSRTSVHGGFSGEGQKVHFDQGSRQRFNSGLPPSTSVHRGFSEGGQKVHFEQGTQQGFNAGLPSRTSVHGGFSGEGQKVHFEQGSQQEFNAHSPSSTSVYGGFSGGRQRPIGEQSVFGTGRQQESGISTGRDSTQAFNVGLQLSTARPIQSSFEQKGVFDSSRQQHEGQFDRNFQPTGAVGYRPDIQTISSGGITDQQRNINVPNQIPFDKETSGRSTFGGTTQNQAHGQISIQQSGGFGYTTSGNIDQNNFDTNFDQGKLNAVGQGESGKNIYSSQQVTSSTGGNGKVRFSITSQAKSDEFAPSKQIKPGGYQQNIFGVTSDKTTFGLSLQEDVEKIPVKVVSAEAQEPQETASFVTSSRNNLQSSGKSTTVNPYPNHRETYSDIKDPRQYYEKPQSKLPEKPFFGSSVSPQVLTTIPVSAYDNSFKSTTEVNASPDKIRYSFGLKAGVSTAKLPGFTTFQQTTPSGSLQSGRFSQDGTGIEFSTSRTPVISDKLDFGSSHTTKSSFGSHVDVTGSRNSQEAQQDIVPVELKLSTVGLNKVAVSSYNKGYTNIPDDSLNVVSSTFHPDLTGAIGGKSTILPELDKSGYYGGKLSTSTSSYKSTKKSSTDSPIIKVDIQSTAFPSFESGGRTAKAFGSESPKTQIILHSSKSEGGKISSTNEVNLGFRGEVTGTPPTVASIFLGKQTDRFPSTTSRYDSKQTYINQNTFGSIIAPVTSPAREESENKPFTTTERAVNIGSRSTVTASFGVETSTQSAVTQATTIEFAINDEVFSTPTSLSDESITLNVNERNYSAPASGVFVTQPTPAKAETESILTSSSSGIFQPKPFSSPTRKPSVFDRFDQTGFSQPGTPHVPPYTISSASPFTTARSGGDEFSTLSPTLPTPLATESNYYPYKPTDENINNMINTLMEVVRQKLGYEGPLATPRPGLVVPPSAGPQTLHSLAIYFANALDNLTSTHAREYSEMREGESTTDSPIIHIDNEELIKSLLTQMTLDNYEDLFKYKDGTTTEVSVTSRVDEGENDLARDDTKYPTEGPGVRQLARVFTEALSAYLEDPETFKKVLHDVRPTEPPPLSGTEAEDEEVLKYSDSDLKSDHPHLPVLPTGVPVSPTWGYILALNKTAASDSVESKNAIGADNENLQSADTQSFVSGLNKVTQEYKTTLSADQTVATTEQSFTIAERGEKSLPENHWTTSPDVAKLWHTTLLVNPAALNENFDSTGFTSLDDIFGAKLTTGTSSEEGPEGTTARVSEIQYELRALPKLDLNSTQVHGILIDFMNATKSEGSARLQRILHKLNISQEEFLDKMKEIEQNPLTRRLILLLISECNSDRNKELETRAASSDDVFDVTQSKIKTEHHESDAKIESDVTTEAISYKRIVHPSLDEDDEDTRALELLNSLYVIASKFGK